MTSINIVNKFWSIGEQARTINILNSKIRTYLEHDDIVEAYSNTVDMLSILSELTENIMIVENVIGSMIPEEIIDEEVDILPE